MTERPHEQLDHFWIAVARGWDIEPREYFERKAVAMGFKSPVEMAVHHMWKRHAKDWPPTPPDYWRCKTCGCLWRDNHDGTVSLGSAKQTSCQTCEMEPSHLACEPLFMASPPSASAAANDRKDP